jgi:hypothetical protein
MASEKATYWMAVGLLALFMCNHFANRFDGKCLASKAQVAAERISAQATHLMAMAEVAMGRTSTQFDRAQAAMAMAQVHMASMQTGFARRQAACARLQTSRAQALVQERMQQMQIQVVRPRPRVELLIAAPRMVPSQDPI